MTVVYRIIDPGPGEEPYTVTVCEADGIEVWRALTPLAIDVATVLNLDGFPTIVDDRSDTDTTEVTFRVATVAEAAVIYPPQIEHGQVVQTTADQHRVIATYAAVLEVVPLADAAIACDLSERELIDEATA